MQGGQLQDLDPTYQWQSSSGRSLEDIWLWRAKGFVKLTDF